MEVTDALNRLPRTLFESYDRMLAHIAENHHEALIRKAFFFIFHARIPLSLKMLVEAIAPVDENNQIIFDATFFDPEKLIKICRSLLYLVKTPSGRNRYDAAVRENQEGVTFCHLTVKVNLVPKCRESSLMIRNFQEYLMSEHLRDHPTLSKFYIRKDDTLMAKKILEYLLLQDFNGPCTSKADAESRLQKHPFYRYCALSWFDHLLDAEEEDSSLFELIDKFVFSSPGHLRTYEQILEVWWGSNKCEVSMSDRDKLQYYYRKDTELDTDLSGALLFFFMSSGPEWISKLFCSRKPNLLNTNSCRFGPPLWIAIQWHREDLARHLIEQGADIQMMCPTQRPPLFATATSTMMSGLYFDPLLKCASLPVCNFRPTPMPASTTSFIHVAAQHTPKLLPKLLDEGLSIDTRAEDGSTPLHLAVMNGDLSTVKMLVESGANINARTHGERTPFHIAISTQSARIIKYFLENNVAIPPDIIATDVEMVARNVGLHEKCIDSAYYISNKTQLFPSIRSTLAHNRKDLKCLQTAVANGPGRHGAMELDNPYLYFTFEGSVLRRIEFKLHSKEILSDSRRRGTTQELRCTNRLLILTTQIP
jgi:ankyrin repeat protein